MLHVSTERVYAYIKRTRKTDEFVVLVDRLWPRGIRKDQLDIDAHYPELGPSHELRKWFGHDAEKWVLFKQKYLNEIKREQNLLDKLELLKREAEGRHLILLYGAKNELHNQAEAIKEWLIEGS